MTKANLEKKKFIWVYSPNGTKHNAEGLLFGMLLQIETFPKN